MVITRKQFEGIVMQAAIDTAGPMRANSFLRIDEEVDARAPALGKSYDAYLAGEYWSREWVKGGARRERMVTEFPAVMLESRSAEIEEINTSYPTQRIRYRLYVLHKIDCPECKRKPTPVQTSQLCHDLLMGVLGEVYDAGYYEGTDEEDEVYGAWLSEGRAKALEDVGYELAATHGVHTWMSEPREIVQWGNLPDHRIAMCEFTVEVCEEPPIQFEYNFLAGRKAGEVQCPCP
jgi:hypothetical protein